jgi:tellurite resistance-related uncharacterized protein
MSHELPQGADLKDFSAHYNQLTVPRSLLAPSRLGPEVWARVVVEEGRVTVRLNGEQQPATPGQPAVIPPETAFHINAQLEPARFYLEYYHEAKLDDGAEVASLLGRRGGGRSSRARG